MEFNVVICTDVTEGDTPKLEAIRQRLWEINETSLEPGEEYVV